MRYKHSTESLDEIAAQLHVEFLLEGSVRRDGSRVRITAQLIQAADQTHLWANSYDEEFEQILNMQSRVAEAICASIQIKIPRSRRQSLARSRPVNAAAHEAYLKGLYHWNKFTPEAAAMGVQHLRRAITIDPRHGPAHAALAQVFGMMGYWGLAPPAHVNPLAGAEALKALEIDDSLSAAHGALACVLCLHDWEFQAGERELRRAIELNPSEATSHLWSPSITQSWGIPRRRSRRP